MKLTDMAIYFHIFLLCLLTVLHVKGTNLHAMVVSNVMYDNVMDNIIEDALRAGYEAINDDGTPIVNLDEVEKCFLAEKQLYQSSDRHILVYVDMDGFYIWDNQVADGWSEKISFSMGEKTIHETKVYELQEHLEKNYNVILTLPTNDGETMMNTVYEYSIVGLSFNRNYRVSSFSGARIHKISSCD